MLYGSPHRIGEGKNPRHLRKWLTIRVIEDVSIRSSLWYLRGTSDMTGFSLSGVGRSVVLPSQFLCLVTR